MADNRPREGGRSTFGWLCQVIMQIVVMHILISFWRSKQGNQVTPLSGRKDGSYRNYFRNNELFDVFVYVSEKSYVDFNSLGTDADLVYSAENRVYTHKFNRSFEVEELKIPARSHFFSDEHVNLFATVFLVPHKAYSSRSTPFHKSVLREGFDGHIIVKSLPLITFREVKHEKGVNLVSSDSSQVIPESHELRKHWIPRLDVNVVYDTSVHILDPHDPYYHVYERVDSHKVYDPLLYLSQFWVLEEHYKHVTPEMAGSPLMLNIHFSTCSPTYYLICAQFKKNSETGGLLGQQSAKEFEMFKRTLMTTNIYMLIFSGAFILLHSVFSFFALKNDIQFWHRNDSMEGLSALSVIISFVCDIIVALYIFDSENVSWLIIFEIAIGLVASAWKVSKAIRIRFKRQYPFIELDNAKNYVESNTRKYDHIAIKYMSILMLPCVLGYAIYSLFYDKHKSWYSYIISVAAGSVYTFGFIMMTPQIYINYKLKSVDHLPWRALIYKSLNTFVDDVASFLIEMPWMHRLSCFRDDIIFFCYLYQRWAYRVDPNRPSAWKAPTPEIESSEQEGGKKALDDSASGGRANTHEGPARRR